MLSVLGFVVLGILACGLVVVGAAFIFSKTVPRMPNKAYRFLLLFALWVPLGFVYDESKRFVYRYSPVPLLEYPRMSWTAALILALLSAALLTFLWPESQRSRTK